MGWLEEFSLMKADEAISIPESVSLKTPQSPRHRAREERTIPTLCARISKIAVASE